jgi:transposase
VKAARANWFEQFADVRVDQLVFIDEFGATTAMQRTHGRAPPGERVVSRVPHGHWKVLSTIAAMTVGGMTVSATFDGATDGDTFVAFVPEGLVPTLVPGRVVVLDNLSAHRAAAVRALVKSAGAGLLPLPPYSPDLNPIELAISKVKTALRKLARRSVDGVMSGIGEALGSVTPQDALHYIAYRGYR